MTSPNRRSFLVASTAGIAGFRFGTSAFGAGGGAIPKRSKPAKSTILFFLCGGSSHIDMWDLKPEAPMEYRGPFSPISVPGADFQISEHLPMTAKVGKHLAIVRSVSDHGRATGDHHAGYYYNLTGNAPDQTFRIQGNDRRPYPDDFPFMGSVVGMNREPHASLPQIITLPHKPSRAPYTRPGQFAGRLGNLHDPFYLYGDHAAPLNFQAPALTLQTDRGRLDDRQQLLGALNTARRSLDQEAAVQNYTEQQAKAFSLLSAEDTAAAFDIASEPESLRDRYGKTLNGMSLLMARKLVEAEVPFITVFWKANRDLAAKCRSAGSWDTHGNNFDCLQNNLMPEFDRAYSALIEDLSQRGLIDDTLVVVSSEMGRKPKIGDPRSGGVDGGVLGAGRDHWTACQSIVLAGGGVQGGQAYGTTDKYGEFPDEKPLSPADITKTVYHSMGVTDLQAMDRGGMPFNLLEGGRPLVELF
ncbi:MAG: hypothetical protein ACI8UO_002693 [Verrucomicrobiales bacterium]|jgi:hypothetical protein